MNVLARNNWHGFTKETWRRYRDSAHVSLNNLRHILSWTWQFQASPQTPDTWHKDSKDHLLKDKILNGNNPLNILPEWTLVWAFPGLCCCCCCCGSQEVGRCNLFLMREPSRLDIVGSGSSLQPMLFSPQRNKPSYSLIPLWHPWPKCLQSHPFTATTLHFPSNTYSHLFLLKSFFPKMWLPLRLRQHISLLSGVWDTKTKKMWGHKSHVSSS